MFDLDKFFAVYLFCLGFNSCLLLELTASQLLAIAKSSDTDSHNRLDLIYSLVPTHYVCNGYLFPGDYYFLSAKKRKWQWTFLDTNIGHLVSKKWKIRELFFSLIIISILYNCGSKLWFLRNVDILFRTPLLPKSYVSYSHYLVSTVYPFVFCKLFAYQPSQKPLNLLKQHFGGMIYERSSTKVAHFVMMR